MKFIRVLATALVLASPAAAQLHLVPSEVRLTPSVPVSAAPAALSVPPLGSSLMTALPTAAALPAAAVAPVAPPLAAAVPRAAAPVAAAPALAAPQTPALSAASAMISGAHDGAKPAPETAGLAFDGGRKLHVLMAAAESVPFIKTGGLADVVNDVSRGLADRGHAVTLMLPKHLQLKTEGFELTEAGHVTIPMNGKLETAKLLTTEHAGVKIVLIDNPGTFQSTKGPYDAGSVYGEDANESRYAFFSRAVLEAARALHLAPDIIHVHDWHASLVPAYAKAQG
ncbi:MAG: glycogen/starch synthase, partial [Elusimicrobia bacterium]|nr:glycogen/starch synthase [Elusimicrobiota bacterium]